MRTIVVSLRCARPCLYKFWHIMQASRAGHCQMSNVTYMFARVRARALAPAEGARSRPQLKAAHVQRYTLPSELFPHPTCHMTITVTASLTHPV